MIKNNDFTPETKSEFLNLVKDKTTAFDLLVNNYNSEEPLDIDSNKIVTRLQTQYVTEDRNEESLRTKDEWDQNEFYQPNEVNVDIAQVTPDKYSSFALLKPNYNFKVDFPLDDDYATDNNLFDNNTFSESSLLVYLQLFKDKMGINISQNSVLKSTVYKHNKIRKAVVKVQNVVLKLCKKPLKVTGLFSGKISLKTKYATYQISNVEKLARIFDTVLIVATKNEAKAYKTQMGKKNKEITFASQVFADVLMSRVNDLQDLENNKKLEKCYWLQFANTLNTFGFNAEQLKLVTEIGAKSASKVCKELGISKNKIVAKMMALGYTYNVVPANEMEALLCAKQKDYTVFEENDSTINQEEPEIDKERIIPEAVNVNEEENADNVSFKEGTKVRKTTAEKVIDKSVVKYLADQSTKLAEKINQGKFKGKKLEVATEEQRLTSLILSYYVQTVNAKPMSVKNDNTYNENEISQAKIIVKGICMKRDGLVQEVVNRDKKIDQKASTFVNMVCKEKYKKTARDYFVGLVKSCINYIVYKEYKSNKKAKDNDDTAKLLESGAKLLESAKLEAKKSNNEPNTTTIEQEPIIENNESKKTDYVPNFVIVDNNDLGR